MKTRTNSFFLESASNLELINILPGMYSALAGACEYSIRLGDGKVNAGIEPGTDLIDKAKNRRTGGVKMKKETIQFVVEAKNGVVEQVGKSSISKPETNFDHKGIKWFDDSKLLKGSRSGVGPEQKAPVVSIKVEVGLSLE